MDDIRLFTTLEVEDLKAPWLDTDPDDYTNFRLRVSGNIAVFYATHTSTVLHKHEFYEIVLVSEGTGKHYYRGVSATLVPGDIFLIEPGEPHSYYNSQMLKIINCQFTEEFLSESHKEILQQISEVDSQAEESIRDRLQLLKTLGGGVNHSEQHEETALSQQVCLDRQGIIQLGQEMKETIEDLFHVIMVEQGGQRIDYEKVESSCLQQILIFTLRAKKNCSGLSNSQMSEKERKINQVIEYMEQHLKDKMNVDFLAGLTFWSTGHFRSIFTEVTGLSPIEYLNRLRIVKSLELIQRDHMKISEAATQVGFSDPAYYSRVFKKIFGYSPRNLVNI